MSALDELVTLGRVTVSLVVVVALVLFTARWAGRTGLRPRGRLEVLDRVGLTRETSLAVVRVGEQALVLGVTARSVALLTTLDAASLTTGAGSGVGPGVGPGVGSVDDLVSEPGAPPQAGIWHRGMEALRDRTARR